MCRRGVKFPSAEGWHVVPGWSESPRKRTYSPLSSRAKRGDPVNKKALRAYRPQTLSTLYTLHSTLCYCHAMRDNNTTLRAARCATHANVPCININDAVL